MTPTNGKISRTAPWGLALLLAGPSWGSMGEAEGSRPLLECHGKTAGGAISQEIGVAVYPEPAAGREDHHRVRVRLDAGSGQSAELEFLGIGIVDGAKLSLEFAPVLDRRSARGFGGNLLALEDGSGLLGLSQLQSRHPFATIVTVGIENIHLTCAPPAR